MKASDYSFLIRPQPKASGNGKAPAKLPLSPGSNGAGNKPILQYFSGIGKIEAKDVTRSKYFKSDT